MTNENRIDKKFSLLRDENKKALITFITFGDPDIETSKKLVLEMEKEGADLIEIGVPFQTQWRRVRLFRRRMSEPLKTR